MQLATMMGALLLARATRGDAISDEFLDAARRRLTSRHRLAPRRRQRRSDGRGAACRKRGRDDRPPRHPAPRLHYAWVVAAVTFVVLLITAGVRATPGLFMVPLESEFGWSRAVISAAIAVNIALFGLIGPFAASVMNRWGLRRVVLAALALLAASVAVSTRMHTEWQLLLLWGVLVGTGTGVTSMVLAAVVATRWFDQRRGVVLGALSAANATGQLVFLPMLAGVVETSGWRSAALIVAARRRGGLRRSCSCSCAIGRATSACGPTARPPTPCRRPVPPAAGPARRAGSRRAHPGVLDARRHLLRLRREHQRPHRHAPHLGLPRRRHPARSARRSCWR